MSSMPSTATALQRRSHAGGIIQVVACPDYVLGLSDGHGRRDVTVPMHDIEDGEWIWALLDSGSDAHTTPPQVDVTGELKPSKNVLVDIQGGNLEAAGSRLISFEGAG